MKQELPPMPERTVEAGKIRARVEARDAVVAQRDDDLWMLKIPLLDEEPITCVVKEGHMLGAETLRGLVRILSKDGEIGALGNTTVAVARDRPVVFVEGLFRQEKGGQVAFGHLKVMVAPTPPHSVACYMLSLGYANTFQRVTLGLVASLEPRGNPPSFIEIHEYRIADVVLGFEHRRVWKLGDQTDRSEVMGVLLAPISNSALSWEDVGYSEVSDARGQLKSMTFFRNSDAEKTELELQERSSGTYQAQGEDKGKPISGTLKTRDSKPILSELGRNRATRDLMAGKIANFEAEAYIPGFDPLAFRVERFTLHPNGTVETAAAPATVRGTYDAKTGTPLEVTMDMGTGNLLETKRLFAAGQL
jgi:hypothetical protein